ncbi:MAG: triphosphoribosyl-dephospho-CoA synthase [Planctomycetaceae bacterium]|jgi:triphosphoribosyl-dephospho-CoA synthase|nr:triphosphoribosyl-dephospho-CoA synthase [Planctomycetaceae bacterium]
MSQLVEHIRFACLLEATAAKPGNVHPRASFADMTYTDLIGSADAVAEILATASDRGVGRTVLDSVNATASVVDCNSNLGIILLLAPLAAVPRDVPLATGIATVLENLDDVDADCVYQAIRLARPGGLGEVVSHGVATPPRISLMSAMNLATAHDDVAACYTDHFSRILDWSLNELPRGQQFLQNWSQSVVRLSLRILADHPDTLIARKCGMATAVEASRRAACLLASGWPRQDRSPADLEAFDAWLREDGHRRNPGTTADLVTATLFAALRDGIIQSPTRRELDNHVDRVLAAE